MKNQGLNSGTILDNRYKIESTLGSGGFGITYLAVNERIDLQVCVKEFFNSEYMYRANDSLAVVVDDEYRDVFEEDKTRLLREARILSGLKEMNGIARVLDYFEANGTAYLVMEYIEGETLKKHISKKGALSEEELLQSMLPLMKTLNNIHEAGVIHRDISPENIMVTPDGDLKLIDFGAARLIGGKTKTTAMVYKDGYAPPEQYTIDNEKAHGQISMPSAQLSIFASHRLHQRIPFIGY